MTILFLPPSVFYLLPPPQHPNSYPWRSLRFWSFCAFVSSNHSASFLREPSFGFHLGGLAAVFTTSHGVTSISRFYKVELLKNKQAIAFVVLTTLAEKLEWIMFVRPVSLPLPKSSRNRKRDTETWMKILLCHMWLRSFKVVLNLLLSQMAVRLEIDFGIFKFTVYLYF